MMDCGRRHYIGKPLQQCLILRMVRRAFMKDRVLGVGQALHHITVFKIILAVSVRREPSRSCLVHEWIVEGLAQLMTQRHHIRKTGARKPRCDPAGIIEQVPPLAAPIRLVARLGVIRVEADDAALLNVAICIQNTLLNTKVEISLVRISPAFFAAPMTVDVSVDVAGKRALTKAFSSTRT